MDGQGISGNAGVSAGNAGTHTLSVGGVNFSASISQAANPAMSIAGYSRTAIWAITAGTFLDLAVDHGLYVIPAPTGSVTIPSKIDKVIIYAITQEGGIAETVIPPLASWPFNAFLPFIK